MKNLNEEMSLSEWHITNRYLASNTTALLNDYTAI